MSLNHEFSAKWTNKNSKKSGVSGEIMKHIKFVLRTTFLPSHSASKPFPPKKHVHSLFIFYCQ